MNLRKVVLWTNGMVMAFNERGEQMSEYQGRFEEVRDKVLAVSPDPEFLFGKWGAWTQPVTKEEWGRRMSCPKE